MIILQIHLNCTGHLCMWMSLSHMFDIYSLPNMFDITTPGFSSQLLHDILTLILYFQYTHFMPLNSSKSTLKPSVDPQTPLYGNFSFPHTNTGRRRSSSILTSPRSRFSQSSPIPPSPFNLDAGRGTPEVIILDPSGHKNTVPVKTRQISDGVYRVEYVASGIGLHSINIFFAGQSIPGSPFGVKISPGKETIYSIVLKRITLK